MSPWTFLIAWVGGLVAMLWCCEARSGLAWLARYWTVFLVAVALALTASGARASDGDTLSFRLHGIDTPEQRQVCPDGWPAGRIATDALAAMVKGRTITCEPRGHDRWGRIIAICRADGYDLGRILVRSGLAWNYDRFSDEYEQDEALARSEGLGVHAHGCQEPWLWRKERR